MLLDERNSTFDCHTYVLVFHRRGMKVRATDEVSDRVKLVRALAVCDRSCYLCIHGHSSCPACTVLFSVLVSVDLLQQLPRAEAISTADLTDLLAIEKTAVSLNTAACFPSENLYSSQQSAFFE